MWSEFHSATGRGNLLSRLPKQSQRSIRRVIPWSMNWKPKRPRSNGLSGSGASASSRYVPEGGHPPLPSLLRERLFLLREKERRGFHTPKIPAPPRGETGAANPHLKEGACAYGIGQEDQRPGLLPGRGRGERGRKAPAFMPGMKSPLSHPSRRRLLLFDVLLDDGDGGTAT